MKQRYGSLTQGDRPATSLVGFLDVTFGVLGLFIVIFAVRIILEQNVAGQTADLIAVLTGTEGGMGRIVLHGPAAGTEQSFEGDPGEVATQAREWLLIQAAQADGPLLLRLVLLPDGYAVELAFGQALSDNSAVRADRYLPVATVLEPAVDSLAAGEIVETWRDTYAGGR